MTTFREWFGLFVLFLLGNVLCQGQTSPVGNSNTVSSASYTCIQRGPYSKVWQETSFVTNDSGDITTNTQFYTELATGICYLTNGQYVDSVEQVDLVPGGAQAVQGRHQVKWNANANTPGGAVTVTTPDGKQLASTVYGLAYYDLATGSNVAIGQLQNSIGAIVDPNQVLYTNAFSNITADIEYTYTKAGLSQDIVLRQAPLPPDAYGLGDASTILQVYTEFFSPPTPGITAVTNNDVVDDQVLDFGDMKMSVGQAFLINSQNGPSPAGPVTKQWVVVSNNTFLIESISYNFISNQLQQIPQASNIKPGRASIRRLAFLEAKPQGHEGVATKKAEMMVAKSKPNGPRLVMDYVLLSGQSNLVLQGDSTYFVTGNVNVTNTLTIEGGTVVKYTNSASAQITATNIVCSTGPYTPGVFTSMNDNSAGTVISNSTGAPAIGAASYLNYGALATTSSPLFYYLRFSYANQAITGSISAIGTNSLTIQDCQFINCGTCFYANFGIGSFDAFPVNAYNVLYSKCVNAFSNSTSSDADISITAVNVTADQVQTFQAGYLTTCWAINSLFTAVTNRSSVAFTSCSTNLNGTGVYTNVGAANYYLVSGSTNQGAGDTNLTPMALLTDLGTKTTWPPIVEPVGLLTNDYMFSPQVVRDPSWSDRGYHYDSVDYAVCMELSNATLTVLPGTVLAGYSTNSANYGIWLYSNGIIDCEGTATSPNYMVQYNAVQEQSNTNWETTVWVACLQIPTTADSSWANFAFTDWSVLAGNGQICGSFSVSACPVTLEDCQFYGGSISTAAVGPIVTSTNSLFRRVNFTVSDNKLATAAPAFYNNLFWQGELTVAHTNSKTFTFQDNLFDRTAVTLASGTINVCSNNAYVTTTNGYLTPTNGAVFLTSSPAYEPGPLGIYYYPTNLTNLIHEGSQPAEDAGLYFYTVTTNEVIEGTNMVSIGFHYVGLTNDQPVDTDGLPAVPDYLNDLPGNGVLNPFLIFDQTEYPNEPNVRLGYWRFNTPALTNEAGVPPTTATGTNLAADWSGDALVMTNSTSRLIYPVLTNGADYFDFGNGTVRFWFKPTWNSGPSAPQICFLAADTNGPYNNDFNLTTQQANGASGANQLVFTTASNQFQCNPFGPFSGDAVLINLQSGLWYQLCLTYSPSNVAFYTNGVLFATGYYPPYCNSSSMVFDFDLGEGILFYPPANVQQTNSFSFGCGPGSDVAPVMGYLDELETFNFPMTAQQVAAGYPYFGGNTTNMLDTYYIGLSDMLQTYVYGFSQPAATNSIPVRLGYWRFDSPLLYAEQGQMPLSSSNVGLAPSWSGTALVISNSVASQITYPDVGSNGWANINCQQGSLRFWFKPNSSTGPGHAAPFVYMGTTNYSQEWALWLSSAGNDISFVTASNGGGSNVNFIASHSLNDTNHWTQIVLTYGPSSSSLYTNGSLAQTGSGVSYWPNLTNRQLGMVIGNNKSNAISINGQFEEMETFNYQLSAAQISNNFQMVTNVDSDLDGIPDLLEDIKLSTSRPFLGAPVTVTGTIEAEQFDMGSNGIGYYTTYSHPTNSYRPTGLFINTNDLGYGYCLDQMEAGEWAQYTIKVSIPQTYMVEVRVQAITNTNGVFQCDFTNGIGVVTNSAGISNSTGPLTITSTNWTIVTNVVYLPTNATVMRLHCLTNATGMGTTYVGRFDYISIYPWWRPGFTSTNTNYVNLLYTNNTFSAALSNSANIQSNVNISSGGTVLITNVGTYYVAQISPNETLAAYYLNSAVYILTNNVEIAGAGSNNTKLVAYNRATTVFCLGESNRAFAQCSNFTLRDITIEAQPHLAVTNLTNTTFELGQLAGSDDTQGSIATFFGISASQFAYNICISNCAFLHGIKSLYSAAPWVSNVAVVNCLFIPTDTNCYFLGTTNGPPENTNTPSSNTVSWQGGDVAIFGFGYNAMVVGNTYIGNSALTSVNTSLPTLTNWPAPDGFVWFQTGGNVFVARNTISNNALEGVSLDGGPNSVVGNTFGTLVSDPSCCALCVVGGGLGSISYSTCFVGNWLYGGRTGHEGLSAVPFTINFSGNYLNLYPPFNAANDALGYAVGVSACQAANVCGNTLIGGSRGFAYTGSNTSALILNNNFGAAAYAGIDYQLIGDSLNTAQIFGNTLGEGVSFHVQLTFTNSFGWFLGGNTYLNANSNSVSLFADPTSSALHIYQ